MPNGKNKSIVCAITGGIGSGKSTVSQFIRDLGYIVISSDDNAKELIAHDNGLKQKLIQAFSAKVFDDNGYINKKFLSGIVFGGSDENTKALNKLNSIVHPYVIEKLINDVSELEEKGEKLIFVESALTYEAGLEDGFDYIIVVNATEENSIERVKRRSNLSESEIKFRIEQQIPRQRKNEVADFVIDNNGNIDQLRKSTELIVSIVKELIL